MGLWGWDVFAVLLFISAPHHQGEQEEGQTRSHFIILNASREERKGRKRGKYKSCRARSREGLVLGWDRCDAEVWGGPRVANGQHFCKDFKLQVHCRVMTKLE